MNVTHRMGAEWIMAQAAGTLSEGEALLVASHLSYVPTARADMATAAAAGGMLLENLAPTPLAEDALNRALARLYEPEEKPAQRAADMQIGSPLLPAPLQHWLGRDIEELKWRFLGPGMRQATLWRGKNKDRLWMLRAKPGTSVPRHGHGGVELTLVLCGSITDPTGTYRRGDVQEMNVADTHELMVGTEEECICLAYTQGQMRFKGIIAKLMKPFLGL